MIDDKSKLSIKEYDYLLCNKSIENKNAFIMAFLPYIEKYGKKIYEDNKEVFNAYYSLDDLISDGVLLASRMYDFFELRSNLRPFVIFSNYFLLRFYMIMRNAYFIKVCKKTMRMIADISKIKRKYLEETGDMPTIETIEELSGYSRAIIKRAYEQISMSDYDFGCYEMEDSVLNDTIIDEINPLVMEELSKFKARDQKIISMAYGLNDEKQLSYSEVGKVYHVTKQRVGQICHDFFEGFQNDYPDAKKYLKEL